jgi:hypothetical protein
METGVAYFGNRTLRHVQRDLEDIASSGFDYVVHCFTENDLLYGHETMRQIVKASHDVGLAVHMDPWGVAGVFGGEAFSKWVTWEMDACQVLADGSRVGVACLNRPELLDFLHTWIDAALDCGADLLFFDEPHWYPGDLWYFGRQIGNDARRWSCRCAVCLELFRDRFGHDMPLDLDDEVRQFRQDAVLALVTDLIGYGSGRGAQQALCLLPHGITFELVGVSDWGPFLQIPGLDIFGTDPYWRAGDTVPLAPYVRPNAAAVRKMCDRYGLEDQFWIQGYGFPDSTEEEPARAIEIALEEGMTNLAVWSYRSCEPISKLWSADNNKVWSVVTQALATAQAVGSRH